MNDKTVLPPFDEDAERATLGSLLIDPAAIAIVSAMLVPDDFYLMQHRMIYTAILKLEHSADLLTVAGELDRTGKLSEYGGDAYLAELTAYPPTALNVQQYARTVSGMSLRRRMIQSSQDTLRHAYDMELDDTKLIDAAQSSLTKAIRHYAANKAISKDEAVDAWLGRFDSLLAGNVIPGIPTRIPEIDYKIGGLKQGKLYIFGGKSGVGKTTIMVNILLNAAKSGRSVAMFSSEMTEPELVEVCIANLAYTKYRAVNLNEGHIIKQTQSEKDDLSAAVLWAAVELRRLPIYLRCIPGMTPAQLRYECKSVKAQYGVELVAVDYIQIMQAGLTGRDVNREREVAYITEELKRTAMDDDLRIAIIAGSQVNEVGDLRESRAIGHHADAVVILEREEGNQLKATFTKNRRGPTGDVRLFYLRESAVIGGISS